MFTYDSTEIANGGTFDDGLNIWQLDYNATTGGENFSGEYHLVGSFVNITAVVPEPTTALLLAAGGLITMVFRRRRA